MSAQVIAAAYASGVYRAVLFTVVRSTNLYTRSQYNLDSVYNVCRLGNTQLGLSKKNERVDLIFISFTTSVSVR